MQAESTLSANLAIRRQALTGRVEAGMVGTLVVEP